jgi:hypothetical protein
MDIWGRGIRGRLAEIGFDAEGLRFESTNEEASRVVTFGSTERCRRDHHT